MEVTTKTRLSSQATSHQIPRNSNENTRKSQDTHTGSVLDYLQDERKEASLDATGTLEQQNLQLD